MKKFLIALAVVATPALAQVPTFTTSSQTYSPLDANSPGYTYALLPAGDDVGTVVQLPFAFPWFGANYSSLLVDTNGFISFDTVNCHSGCYTNGTLPSSASPNNAIFAYWDDLSTSGAGSITTYSSSTEFVVQYSGVDDLNTGATVNLQIHLTPSGTVTVIYGDFGTGGTSGTAGYENAAGTQAKYMLPSVGGTCTATVQGGCCTTSCDGPGQGYTIVIGPPMQPDLLVDSVTVSNLVVDSGGVWNFTVQGVLRNYGQTAASNFTWKAFLSTDTLVDANDILVATGATLSIGPTATASVSASATTSIAPPTGSYYVLIQVDPTNVVVEANEANNVGSTTAPFISGVDLVATSITGVSNSGGGNVDNLSVSFTNRGTTSAGTVAYKIFLSTDSILDASDFPIYTGSRVITGGETANDVVPVTMPANSPSGTFHYILQVDPANLITEASETNNVVASSSTVVLSRADIVNSAISLVDPLTGLAVTTAKFGESVQIVTTLANTGGANAMTYSVGLVLSTDTSLSLLADQLVCEVAGPSLTAHAAATNVTVSCPLPLLAPNGTPLVTGQYYLFAVADSRGQIFESNKGNNSQYLGPVRITAPGPDLSVANVTAPASAGVGEVIPVTRTLRNVGNVDAPAATYRYYASANDIVTTEDIPLTIVTAPGMTGTQDGTVTLAHGAADSATELLQLPPTMPSGPYYIGCIVDPLGLIVDIDPTNNALASRLVQVAPSSLQIVSTSLPDATVGRPFNFGLAAVGVNGTSTWALSGQPSWMVIDAASGTLTGTPTGAPGVVSVVVTLTNGARQTSVGLALRVLAPSSQVAITTVNLPPIINSSGVTFTYALGAAGGFSPYTWRVSAGALPTGLVLNADGTITGAPRGVANGPVSFTAEVRDAVGSRDQRVLTGRLVAAGAITIQTLTIADALVGTDYLAQIAVQNADGSALAKPLTWTVVGTLPDGMSLNAQSEIAELSGRPAQAGLFPFALTVTDANGRSDSLDYTLDVYPPRYQITATLPAVLRPSDAVNVTFSVAPAGSVKFAVVSGSLPPGLTLSADGVLSGTVANDDTELGAWTFVVDARDSFGAEGLAPFSLRVEAAPRKTGCSATGAGPLALLGLALLALRRRAGAGAMLAVLVAVLPFAARAQYQVTGPTATTYQSLPAGYTTVTGGATVALPFDFPFYGGTINSVGFSPFGYLSTSGSSALSSTAQSVPSTDAFGVRSFIAPWWDWLGSGSNGLRFAVLGSAPARIAVFEWKDVPDNDFGGGNNLTFQVRLFETTGHIQFVYAGIAPSSSGAAVGVQGDLGNGVAALACSSTPNCSPTSFPKNSVIDYYLPPDLQISSVSVPQTGYAGVAFPMLANVTNRGGRPANQVDVTFYVSADAVLDPSDVVLGTSTATLIDAGQTAQIAVNASLPANLTAGNKFIFAVVDPANTISEINENNNTSTPVGIVIGGPLADLAAANFSGPLTAAPGAMVQVTRSIRNAGNAASAAFKYSYFLSDNPVISVSDRALGSVGSGASLAALATDTAMDSLPLPADLTPGNYWLGFCVNYDSSTATFGGNEITTVNDCLGSSAPVTISTGTLAVIAPTLPMLTQFAAFGLRLQAVGGSGQYTWQVSGGALPAGVTLSAAGDLGGTPTSAGSFSFDVKVTSGTLTDTKSLSLTVSAGNLPLVLVDQVLTSPQFGLPYQASLIAVGGKPPYTWVVTDTTALPAGLALASDGTLEGRATQAGDFSFPVQVTDSAGAMAAKQLSMKVVNPSALAIATTALPTAHLNRNYQQALVAVGGRAPYSWSVVRVQQLPQNPTEFPQPEVVGAAVTPYLTNLGLTIDAAKGLIGKPLVAGLFSLTLQVSDGSGTVDHSTVLLQVTYDSALVITTTSLPDAYFDEPYANVKLAHNGGVDAKGIAFSTPCVELGVHPGSFTCAPADPAQQLPPGLILANDGTISGTANGGLGTYTFLVKLTDASGRQDVRALSIRVNGDFAAQKSGCSGTPASPSLLALVALVALASRRRR